MSKQQKNDIISNLLSGRWIQLFFEKIDALYFITVIVLILGYSVFMAKVEKKQTEINTLERKLADTRSGYISVGVKVYNLTIEKNLKTEIQKRELGLDITKSPNKLIKIKKSNDNKNNGR